VERASELGDTALALDEPGPSVPARVVVTAEALFRSDDHDRLIADLKIHVLADPLDLIEATCVEPRFREEAIDFEP
jgi:hypothetical protein